MEDYNEYKVELDFNGGILFEFYFLNGKSHRLGKPAYINYHENGKVYCEAYWVNGHLHRIDNPAVIYYSDSGYAGLESYFLLGHNVLKEDFYTPGFIDAFILEHS